MEAQQIITMSINKITGSRGQRGGVNLRKNLLVATVLHSARAMYYEEMCNRMARNAEQQREMSGEVEEEDDCTEAPDWGDSSNSDDESSMEESCERVESDSTRQPVGEMDDKENRRPAQSTESSSVQARLEHHELCNTPLVVEPKSDAPADKERSVLGQKNTNNSSPSMGCSACKRKRSDSAEELREACESILPKRAKSLDSECQSTEELLPTTTPSTTQNSEGSITSLVSIFKSGFHGLSGDASPSGQSTNMASSNNHLQQSSYASSMPRPFEQLQMPIAAC